MTGQSVLEEAGNDAASGGPGEANLVIDNDGGVDVGAHKSLADGVEVHLIGSSRVADRHPDVGEARELLLGGLHDGTEGLHVSNLNLGLLLVDINHLQFLSVLLSTIVANLSNENSPTYEYVVDLIGPFRGHTSISSELHYCKPEV